MAAPSFVDAGTGATDAGGVWSYTCQAPAAAGRIIVVQILQDGSTTGAVAVTGSSNINDLAGSAGWTTVVSEAPVGSPTAALQSIFIGRATGTSAPTISGTNSTSEDLYIRSYQFTDVATGTTLATVIENGTAGATVNEVGSSNTAADAGVTTLGADRLALNFVAVNDDNVISAFTGESGGNWQLLVAPYAESSGTDGAIGLQASYGTPLSHTDGTITLGYGVGGVASAEMQAQSFATTGAVTASRILLLAGKAGNPTDNFVIELRTDSSGVPSSTVLASSSFAGTGIALDSAGGTWLQFEPNVSLSASTTYWVVARRSGSLDASNLFKVAASTTDVISGSRYTLINGSWTSGGTSDLVYAILTSADASGATINGGTGSIVDIDAWGVVGFALIGTTASGPQTLYGTSVSAFSHALTALGRLAAKARAAITPAVTLVTQGRVTRKGASAQTLTATIASQGARTQVATSAQAFTVDLATAGTAGKTGRSAQTFTLAEVAAGRVTRKGAATMPVALTEVAAGTVTRKGAATVPLTVALTTQGQRTVHGQAAQTLTATLTATGTVTGGVVTQYGTAALDATATITSAGTPTRVAAATAAHTVTIASTGVRTVHGAAALAVDTTIAAAGRRQTTGQAAVPLTLALASTGVRSVPGQASFALTATLTTTGRADAHGQAAVPLALAVATAGTRDTFATVALPLVAAIVSDGQVVGEANGQAAFAATIGISSTGTVTVNARRALVSWVALEVPVAQGAEVTGSATLQLAATIAAAGTRETHAAAAVPLALNLAAAGTVTGHAASIQAFTLALVSDGTVVGEQTGNATQAFTVAVTTAGTVTVRTASAQALTLALAANGTRTTHGTTTQTLTATIASLGRLGAHTSSILPLTVEFTATAEAAGQKYGRATVPLTITLDATGRVGAHATIALPLIHTVTPTGRVTAHAHVTLPLAAAIQIVGRAGMFATAEPLPFQITVTADGAVRTTLYGQAVPLELLLALTVEAGHVYYGASAQALVLALASAGKWRGRPTTGHLEDVLAGIIDGKALGHIEFTERGHAGNGTENGHVEQPLVGAISE